MRKQKFPGNLYRVNSPARLYHASGEQQLEVSLLNLVDLLLMIFLYGLTRGMPAIALYINAWHALGVPLILPIEFRGAKAAGGIAAFR